MSEVPSRISIASRRPSGEKRGLSQFASQARTGVLTADELLQRYVTIVYSRTGSYEETARRLGLDRRTVKAKVDAVLLARLRPAARK